MTANTMVVRNMVGVVTAIALVTMLGLAYGRRGPAPAEYVPPEPVDTSRPPTPEEGASVFERLGCNVCHTTDGRSRVGPSFAQRWGTPVSLSDGSRVTFDEVYVRESILAPQAKAQPGYPPSMPLYDAVLKQRDVEALIAYLRTL